MTPTEFVDLAFVLLEKVNAVTIDEYFAADPSGLIYAKIALDEPSKGTIAMTVSSTWSDASFSSQIAQGPTAWTRQLALDLLTTSPLPAA